MDGRACKEYIFQSYNTSTFSAMRFDENPFTCQCEKENKKVSGFQISHFYWSFSSNTMAVKAYLGDIQLRVVWCTNTVQGSQNKPADCRVAAGQERGHDGYRSRIQRGTCRGGFGFFLRPTDTHDSGPFLG